MELNETRLITGREIVNDAAVVAAREKATHKAMTDETGAARHEYLHALPPGDPSRRLPLKSPEKQFHEDTGSPLREVGQRSTRVRRRQRR
jgi:hypothetical protein